MLILILYFTTGSIRISQDLSEHRSYYRFSRSTHLSASMGVYIGISVKRITWISPLVDILLSLTNCRGSGVRCSYLARIGRYYCK